MKDGKTEKPRIKSALRDVAQEDQRNEMSAKGEYGIKREYFQRSEVKAY